MKTIGFKQRLSVVLIFILIASISLSAMTNDANRHVSNSQKSGHIAEVLGLNDSEAQAFTAIFNKAEDKQKELYRAERDAFFALKDASEKGSPELEALLDSYIKAKKANADQHIASFKEYRKLLGSEKTAKLYTALKTCHFMSSESSIRIELDDSESESPVVPL